MGRAIRILLLRTLDMREQSRVSGTLEPSNMLVFLPKTTLGTSVTNGLGERFRSVAIEAKVRLMCPNFPMWHTESSIITSVHSLCLVEPLRLQLNTKLGLILLAKFKPTRGIRTMRFEKLSNSVAKTWLLST